MSTEKKTTIPAGTETKIEAELVDENTGSVRSRMTVTKRDAIVSAGTAIGIVLGALISLALTRKTVEVEEKEVVVPVPTVK